MNFVSKKKENHPSKGETDARCAKREKEGRKVGSRKKCQESIGSLLWAAQFVHSYHFKGDKARQKIWQRRERTGGGGSDAEEGHPLLRALR